MKIDRLNQGTILVAMAAQDMRDYALDFERNADVGQVRAGLKKLLCHVGEACAISPRGRSFLVEALPAREGCLLVISVHPARRRVYHVKGGRRMLYAFEKADDLLDWLRIGDAMRYTLYRYGSGFVLIPAPSAPRSSLRRLAEYSRLIAADRITQARVAEYGVLVKSVSALSR